MVEMYERLLEFIKPDVPLSEVSRKTEELGQQLCPKSGSLAGGGAHLTCHGRGLGDDFPLATGNEESRGRFADWRFPESGVFIIKPGVTTGNGSSITWGDTCRVTRQGAVRMGKAPHGMIVAG